MRGRRVDRERVAHVVAFLLNFGLEMPRGSRAIVPWSDMPRLLVDLVAHIERCFGSLRSAALWMAVVEQADGAALSRSMPQDKPWTEHHLRSALCRVRASGVEARVSRILAKANRNRSAMLQLRANPEAFCAALHPEPAPPELQCRCGAPAKRVLCSIAVSDQLDWTGSSPRIGAECDHCEHLRIYGRPAQPQIEP